MRPLTCPSLALLRRSGRLFYESYRDRYGDMTRKQVRKLQEEAARRRRLEQESGVPAAADGGATAAPPPAAGGSGSTAQVQPPVRGGSRTILVPPPPPAVSISEVMTVAASGGGDGPVPPVTVASQSPLAAYRPAVVEEHAPDDFMDAFEGEQSGAVDRRLEHRNMDTGSMLWNMGTGEENLRI